MEKQIDLYNFENNSLDNSVTLPEDTQRILRDLNLITLPNNRIYLKVKSVKKPFAQSLAMCEVPKLSQLKNTLNNILDKRNTQLGIYEKAIIELQFLYGLRISEALNIHYSDVLFNGSIKIKGIKGSENRIVYPVQFRDFWIHLHNSSATIPASYNRFYFYRIYKKFGISGIMGSNTNTSVTHYLRYMFVKQLVDSGQDFQQIKHILGHKSIKSTIHYLNNLNENTKA